MDSRALYTRAFATAAAVVMASTISFVAPAGADHADHETCRSYAQVPNPFVKIEAEDGKFDTNCLKAPADRGWRIYRYTKHDVYGAPQRIVTELTRALERPRAS